MSYIVVIQDPARGWDNLTIGPFERGDEAREEAHHWRRPDVRAMVRYLWNGDDLRRDILEAGEQAR
jgi:hypothetical protein